MCLSKKKLILFNYFMFVLNKKNKINDGIVAMVDGAIFLVLSQFLGFPQLNMD